MPDNEEKPLFVGDITGAEVDAAAARRDVDEIVDSMVDAAVPDRVGYQIAMMDHLLVRNFGYVVMANLEEQGVEEAPTIIEGLDAIDPADNPLMCDLSAVASAFDASRYTGEGTDVETSQELKRLAMTAHAGFALSAVKAVLTRQGAESKNAFELLGFAKQAIDAASLDVSENTTRALTELAGEIEREIKYKPEG